MDENDWQRHVEARKNRNLDDADWYLNKGSRMSRLMSVRIWPPPTED